MSALQEVTSQFRNAMPDGVISKHELLKVFNLISGKPLTMPELEAVLVCCGCAGDGPIVFQNLLDWAFARSGPSEQELREQLAVLKQRLEDVTKEYYECTGFHTLAMQLVWDGKSPPSDIERLQQDVEHTQTEIDRIQGDLEKQIRPIHITMGGDPHSFTGWDCPSTGYVWSCDVADESVVKVITRRGRREDTSNLCGGGQDIEYQFYGICTGATLVKVKQQRSWSENDGDGQWHAFRIHVEAPPDEELQRLVLGHRARYAELEATLKEMRPNGARLPDQEIDTATLGLEIFTLRRAAYSMEHQLEQIFKEDVLVDLRRELLRGEDEERDLRSEIHEKEERLESLDRELADLTGEPIQLREVRLEPLTIDAYWEDPITKMTRELNEQKTRIHSLKDTLRELDEQIEEKENALHQAREAKA